MLIYHLRYCQDHRQVQYCYLRQYNDYNDDDYRQTVIEESGANALPELFAPLAFLSHHMRKCMTVE